MLLVRQWRFIAVVCLAMPGSPALASPRETIVQAPGPAGPLQGAMLAPAMGHGPLVLIIPGSGPTDRDGNNPRGLKASTYRLLAEGLAARGITTVRIDKRGMFGSAGATPDPNNVTIADYAADIASWTNTLRKSTGAGCVWLLGHSEGGLVALAAARQPGICGLILLAAPGRKMADILRAQLKANPANARLLPQALPAIDRLEAGQRVDTSTMDPALLPLFRPAVQGFLISAFAADPAKLLAAVTKPVLILQGERDLQIGVADARLLAKADPAAKLVLLPNTNHVYKTVASDDMQANLATYADPSLPLAPGVIEEIDRFLNH
jgi:pimeloyl-ACP methyl ester carboxylesterase